ncbi:hypothetical protein Dimus_035421, partial [Dionaea muscipula]
MMAEQAASGRPPSRQQHRSYGQPEERETKGQVTVAEQGNVGGAGLATTKRAAERAMAGRAAEREVMVPPTSADGRASESGRVRKVLPKLMGVEGFYRGGHRLSRPTEPPIRAPGKSVAEDARD